MGRFVTLGEIMLRLKSPGHERLLQSPVLEATFGGGEANVAVSLANFGMDSSFVSALPANAIGDAAVAELRRYGVDVSQTIRSGDRVGLYFLEAGANQRPSKVIYDRAGAAIATAEAADFDWQAIFSDAKWFHITGITPALSARAAALSLEACRQARQHGVKISCDLNYRRTLWNYGKTAPQFMPELVRLVDVCIGGKGDCQQSLGIDVDSPETDEVSDSRHFEGLTAAVMAAFPNLSILALTLRDSQSADRNGWSACLRSGKEFIVAPRYEIADIVDRVGTGDSFTAGLIYGLAHYDDNARALAFATAASCLKHAISGDFNRVSVAEVEKLMAGDASGRVQR